MTTYSCEAYWPVLKRTTKTRTRLRIAASYHVRFDIEARTPGEALVKFKEFHEMAESGDDSDGPTSLVIWDESRSRVLLEELSDEERFARAGGGLVKALESVVRRVNEIEARSKRNERTDLDDVWDTLEALRELARRALKKAEAV